MEREAIETMIRAAFMGIRLGSGLSLQQAAAADNRDAGLTEAHFAQLPAAEVIDDWSSIPVAELCRDRVGYLDREGLRYYLPALMLWLLDHYDDEDSRLADAYVDLTVIGTLGALTPGREFREHYYAIFDTFSEAQRAAIASYVEALPRLVHLRRDDAVRVERALRDYWRRFLPVSRA